MKKLVLLSIVVCLLLPAFTMPDSKKTIYAQKIVSYVFDKNLYDLASLRFTHTGSIPSCRQEFYFALALLATDNKANNDLANEILAKYLSLQVTDPQSPYYGSWYYKELLGKTDGLEWDMFNPIPVFHMVFDMPEKLTESNRKLALASMSLVSKGLAAKWYPNHIKPEAIGHTNYHLMYCADLLLASEYCEDRLGQSLAVAALENWLSWTKRNGVTEFNSPTYLAVDLQALSAIELYSKDKRAVELAMTAADILIADGLLHFKRPKALLGANSRSYDVLSGKGRSCSYLEMALSGKIPDVEDISSILNVFFGHRNGDWVTGLWIKSLDQTFTFESKWAPDLWAVRKSWFGESLVLGTSGMGYGSQDRNLVVDRQDSSWLCSFVPVIAINDSPEKLPEIGGGSGHNHIKTPMFTVQDENKALQLFDITYKEPDFDMNRLSLAFLFPKSEVITFDNPTKPDSPFAIKTDNDLVMVRPFVSSSDSTIHLHQKGELTIIETRLVHDLRKDVGRRFFVGFAIEIAENVYDAKNTFEDWLKKPFMFAHDEKLENVNVSFDGIKIDYDSALKRPTSVPLNSGEVFLTPWTCMEEDGLWTSDWDEVKY